jgi:hypothetical protein
MLKTAVLVLLTVGTIVSGCARPAPATDPVQLAQDEKSDDGSGGGGSM